MELNYQNVNLVMRAKKKSYNFPNILHKIFLRKKIFCFIVHTCPVLHFDYCLEFSSKYIILPVSLETFNSLWSFSEVFATKMKNHFWFFYVGKLFSSIQSVQAELF